MRINIQIDVDKITWDDMIAIEDAAHGNRTFTAMANVISKHLADENGERLSHDDAMAQLRKLTITESGEVIKAFNSAVREAATPKANGGD